MAGCHQVLFHAADLCRDRQVQIDVGSCLECDSKILVMQCQSESQRVVPFQHGAGSMTEGPGACSPMTQSVNHSRHRQSETFSKCQCFGDGDVAPCHEHLIHRFDLLPASHRAEVMDGSPDDAQDGT